MRTRGVRIRLAALRDLVMIGRAVIHGYLFGTPRCTYTANEFTAVCGALAEAEVEAFDNFTAATNWRMRALNSEAKVATLQRVLEAHGPFGYPGCTPFTD